MLNRRMLNLAGFFACMAMLVYALFAQYQLLLDPCPLCIFQRVAVIVLAVVFLAAAVHNPGHSGARVYAGCIALAGVAGVAVAGRHVWLQNLPPDQVPACGPGLDFMLEAFPPLEMLRMVLTGSGECADISWSLLGLSMPMWVLIAIGVVAVCGVLNNLRQS